MLGRTLQYHSSSKPLEPLTQLDVQHDVLKYASWIRQIESPKLEEEVYHLREVYPARFWDLCKLHLTTIVDLPNDFMDNIIERQLSTQIPILQSHGLVNNPKWLRWNPLRTNSSNTVDSLKIKLDTNMVTGIISIMDYLSVDENVKQEGLFRKTGSIIRQREIKRLILEQIQTGGFIDFHKLQVPVRKTRSSSKNLTQNINIHDIASVLKLILSELPQPLLTEDLLPVFNQIAELTAGNFNDRGERVLLNPTEMILAQAKQLKALRILTMYLPADNALLLRQLLDLLTKTLEYSTYNLMTAEGLGTLFGLLMFAPGKSGKSLHTTYSNLTSLATLMIREGSNSIFAIPTSLSKDILNNCYYERAVYKTTSEDSGLCTSNSANETDSESIISIHTPIAQLRELPPLKTQLIFARTVKPEDTPIHVHAQSTEFAVAELCAQIQALPDKDTRKRRLIQRFNHSNGGLTPREHVKRSIDESFVTNTDCERKRQSRSIRTSIRNKIVTKLNKFDSEISKINLFPEDEIIPLSIAESSSSMETNGVFCCPLLETMVSPFVKIAQQTATLSASRKKKIKKNSPTLHISNSLNTTVIETIDKSVILDGAFFPSGESSDWDSDEFEEDELSYVYASKPRQSITYLEEGRISEVETKFRKNCLVRRVNSIC